MYSNAFAISIFIAPVNIKVKLVNRF